MDDAKGEALLALFQTSRHWSPEEDEVLLQHVLGNGTRKWNDLKRVISWRDNKACCNRYLFLRKRFVEERESLVKAGATATTAPVTIRSRQGLISFGSLTFRDCESIFLSPSALRRQRGSSREGTRKEGARKEVRQGPHEPHDQAGLVQSEGNASPHPMKGMPSSESSSQLDIASLEESLQGRARMGLGPLSATTALAGNAAAATSNASAVESTRAGTGSRMSVSLASGKGDEQTASLLPSQVPTLSRKRHAPEPTAPSASIVPAGRMHYLGDAQTNLRTTGAQGGVLEGCDTAQEGGHGHLNLADPNLRSKLLGSLLLEQAMGNEDTKLTSRTTALSSTCPSPMEPAGASVRYQNPAGTAQIMSHQQQQQQQEWPFLLPPGGISNGLLQEQQQSLMLGGLPMLLQSRNLLPLPQPQLPLLQSVLPNMTRPPERTQQWSNPLLQSFLKAQTDSDLAAASAQPSAAQALGFLPGGLQQGAQMLQAQAVQDQHLGRTTFGAGPALGSWGKGQLLTPALSGGSQQQALLGGFQQQQPLHASALALQGPPLGSHPWRPSHSAAGQKHALLLQAQPLECLSGPTSRQTESAEGLLLGQQHAVQALDSRFELPPPQQAVVGESAFLVEQPQPQVQAFLGQSQAPHPSQPQP